MPARRTARATRLRTPRKGDLTEQAILDTAERLLAERPLSEIAIDELARGAGISRPSFYFYFESREAILRTLSERMSEELYRSSQVWLRRVHESPTEAIRRALEANVALWREHGPVLRATVQASERDAEVAASGTTSRGASSTRRPSRSSASGPPGWRRRRLPPARSPRC